jgi:hypothetical protein
MALRAGSIGGKASWVTQGSWHNTIRLLYSSKILSLQLSLTFGIDLKARSPANVAMTDWKERDDATTTIDDVVTTNQRLPK